MGGWIALSPARLCQVCTTHISRILPILALLAHGTNVQAQGWNFSQMRAFASFSPQFLFFFFFRKRLSSWHPLGRVHCSHFSFLLKQQEAGSGLALSGCCCPGSAAVPGWILPHGTASKAQAVLREWDHHQPWDWEQHHETSNNSTKTFFPLTVMLT